MNPKIIKIRRIKKIRKRDETIQMLVTSFDNEEKDLYFYHNRSAINTLSKELAENRDKKFKEIIIMNTNKIE